MAILKSDIFNCSDSFERGNQFNSISDRTNLQYIQRSRNLHVHVIYQTWPEQNKNLYVSPEIWNKDFRHSIGPMSLKCILFDSWTFKI